jgi:hypothetical protein
MKSPLISALLLAAAIALLACGAMVARGAQVNPSVVAITASP